MLIAVCVLSPAPLENVLSFRLRFGGVLRGRFVPRTCFDRVPAGTVLVGTRLFITRSDYKKWCTYREHVPRTCSRWNCTENKCERPDRFPLYQALSAGVIFHAGGLHLQQPLACRLNSCCALSVSFSIQE